MPGDPQPVIYYHGNKSLFDLIISKELSERLVGLQNTPATKPDDIILSGSFSSICRGFCFVPYDSIMEEEQERVTFYSEPCLHLYWTDCCDQDQYKTSVKPEITKWIEEVEKVHASVGWLIVYCITKESKAKRKQQQLGEKIKNDFCSKPEQYSLLKLASSDMSRVLDSWSALVTKINTLSFNTFQRNMQPYIEKVNKMMDNIASEDIYNYFLYKLDVAIGHEMTCQYEQALGMYNDLHLLLEQTITKHSSQSRYVYPHWLKKMTSSWYQCWDCPNLTHPEKAWKYIVPIHSGSAPLLVIRTFVFMREASLLSMLCRSWLLAERALQVLHSAARELRGIKFNYPDGVFEAWAYMTCMETVSAILSQVSRANLEDMTSSLLLIRASLWEYGLQKLYKLGKFCQLLPTDDVPDDHLISRITSGVTQHSSSADDECEDQGQLLMAMLKSKQSFTAKYLELGEMVIGAFKHAGRKRTAFTVGLQMAKFQMELGLINEAEQLLNDTCSLYCPEKWTMFSANAVIMLAECQKSLNLDSKYLRSLLLLIVLPPVIGTSHDPNKCLDEVIQLSKSNQNDVVLDWNPVFSVVKVTPDNSEYLVSNTVTVTVSLLYHGQKELSVDSLSLLMRTSIKSLIHSPEVSTGPSICSGLVHNTITAEDAEPSLTPIPPENLYDLDINSNCSDNSDYRPLHDHPRLRRKTISETYSSYSLDLASIGVDGAFEEESNEPEFVISTTNIVLHPGENELKLHGKPATSGQYYGRKLTLSVGKLSFVSMVTSAQWSKGVPVLLKPIEISFGLEPTLGAFYAGLVQKCKIVLKTGPENPIKQDSILNLSCSTGIKFIPEPDSPDRLSEMTLTLPAINNSSEWSDYLSVYLPSVYKEPNILMSEDDFIFSSSKPPTAWNHEIVVGCQWLMPPHVATLPITSPEPLNIGHQICCTPDRSFLQFTVTNHWPHGVKLSEEQLTVPKSVSSEPMQVPAPEVLWDEENFSYLWELQCADVDTIIEEANVKCLFDLSSQLIMDNEMDHLSVDHRYPFALPGVNALYCIECIVEPVSSDRVIESNLCQLKMIVRCCSPLGTDCPKKFHYTIQYDDVYWHVLQGVNGTAPIEKASRTVQIKVDIIPQMYGELPVPIVNITKHSRRRTSVKGSGQEDVFVPVDKSLIYNSSRGMRIYVYSDSRHSPLV